MIRTTTLFGTLLAALNLGALHQFESRLDALESPYQAELTPKPPPGPDYSAHCDRSAPEGFNRMVAQASAEFEVDPWVLAVTVYRESDCRAHVTGGAGEIGLTQIGPNVWAETLKGEGLIAEAKDLYDPLTNLRASAWILNRLSHRAKGSEQETFRRYNGAGPRARRYASEQVAVLTSVRGS